VAVDMLGLRPGEPITVRIGVRRDARNVGGINLFGREFGNYPEDLGLRLEYDSPIR
jgi:predicted transcriptional regulator